MLIKYFDEFIWRIFDAFALRFWLRLSQMISMQYWLRNMQYIDVKWLNAWKLNIAMNWNRYRQIWLNVSQRLNIARQLNITR